MVNQAARVIQYKATGEFSSVNRSVDDLQRRFDRSQRLLERNTAQVQKYSDEIAELRGKPILSKGEEKRLARLEGKLLPDARKRVEAYGKEVDDSREELDRLGKRQRVFRQLAGVAAVATAGVAVLSQQLFSAVNQLEKFRQTALDTNLDVSQVAQVDLALRPVFGEGAGSQLAQAFAALQDESVRGGIIAPEIAPALRTGDFTEGARVLAQAGRQALDAFGGDAALARLHLTDAGYKGIESTLISLGRNYDAVIARLNDPSVAANAARVNELNEEWRNLQTQLSETTLSIASALAPALTSVATILTDVASGVSKLLTDFPILTQAFGVGLVLALAAVAGGFIKARIAALNAAIATRGFGAALKGALASTGIGLLLVGIGLLVEHFDTVKETIIRVVNAVIRAYNRLPFGDVQEIKVSESGIVTQPGGLAVGISEEPRPNPFAQAAQPAPTTFEISGSGRRATGSPHGVMGELSRPNERTWVGLGNLIGKGISAAWTFGGDALELGGLLLGYDSQRGVISQVTPREAERIFEQRTTDRRGITRSPLRPRVSDDSPEPTSSLAPTSTDRSSTNNVTNNVTISVNQQPGQSGESLADDIVSRLQELSLRSSASRI